MDKFDKINKDLNKIIHNFIIDEMTEIQKASKQYIIDENYLNFFIIMHQAIINKLFELINVSKNYKIDEEFLNQLIEDFKNCNLDECNYININQLIEDFENKNNLKVEHEALDDSSEIS